MKLDPYLIPIKINSKWIKDINIRPETVKLLGENQGKKLLVLGLGNDFFNMMPKAPATKAKTNR